MSLLQNQLLSKISHPDSTFEDDDFLNLFRHQMNENLAYRAYVDKSALPISDIVNWLEIPAIPTDAYKSSYNPASFDLREHEYSTFFTSGTTSDQRGSHHFRNKEIYESSIISGWESLGVPLLWPDTLFLTPTVEESPHSSLSHMMETLKTSSCDSAHFLLSDGHIDLETFRKVALSRRPVSLIGTALAFFQLFEILEATGDNFSLPAGSWAMETGGYKGTQKSLTKEELYKLFTLYLGIQQNDIWNEYSMTELSSQFYTRGIQAPHRGPAWTRIKVIDPETLLPVNVGEMGYLVIYDLANYDSCLAIMTQDLAIYHDARSFTLIGRDPSALPRGCSRSL